MRKKIGEFLSKKISECIEHFFHFSENLKDGTFFEKFTFPRFLKTIRRKLFDGFFERKKPERQNENKSEEDEPGLNFIACFNPDTTNP